MTRVPGNVAITLLTTPPRTLEKARTGRCTGRIRRYHVRSLMYFSRQTSLPDWKAATMDVMRYEPGAIKRKKYAPWPVTSRPKVAAVTNRSIAKFANIIATRNASEKRTRTSLSIINGISRVLLKSRFPPRDGGNRTRLPSQGKLQRTRQALQSQVGRD